MNFKKFLVARAQVLRADLTEQPPGAAPERGGDDVDQAQGIAEASAAAAFHSRKMGELARVNAALQRIQAGTFGQCQSCEEDIGDKRLAANPTGQFCVECQAESEKAASGIRVGVTDDE